LNLARGILPATFAELRRCGAGGRECVVYWVGPIDRSGAVERVVHPPHDAGPEYYNVDAAWVTSFFLHLRSTRDTTRAQVHTHPGNSVRHSPADDRFALAPSIGFVSLVLPHFAMGSVTLEGSYAALVEPDGWTEKPPTEVIRWD
jgi:hypothetical protein